MDREIEIWTQLGPLGPSLLVQPCRSGGGGVSGPPATPRPRSDRKDGQWVWRGEKTGFPQVPLHLPANHAREMEKLCL